MIDADGSLLGVYRKMHVPDDPQFFEKYYFTPGDRGFQVFETRFGKIGVCICWDQWFPEAARLTAMKGADIIFYPTAIGWLPSDRDAGLGDSQLAAWETVQKSHAIVNGIYIASVNRCGLETSPDGESIDFWGRSFVADPAGNTVARASGDEETLFAEVDFSEIERQRIAWPFLRDRRIDAYGDLSSRYSDSE